MKIKFLFGITLFALLVLNACGSDNSNGGATKPSKETLKKSISSLEDSLSKMQKKGEKIENLYRIELINRLLAFYRNYPKDDFSAQCLDKTQMIYSNLEAPEYAIAYCDTLIELYPKYENRALILESQGANYDVFVTPRDSAMVRKYYTMLLNEYPEIEKDKREGILKRLKNNHLSFDEYVATF